MREVKEKRQRWRATSPRKGRAAWQAYDPGRARPGRHIVVDHQHLARALHDEGVKKSSSPFIGDFTMVERERYGAEDNRRLVYPYDARVSGRHFRDLRNRCRS